MLILQKINLANVKTEVVKKTVYDKLVAKVNNIDTSGFILRTKYNADKTELEKKIRDTSKLVKKADFAKVIEIEGKLPSNSGLVTTSALTAVENKIPSVSNLVKETNYNTKVSELKNKITNLKYDKYITTQKFDKLSAENFAARLVQANLIRKIDFHAKLSSLIRKITSIKTRHLLVENELKKLKTYGSIYFRGKSHTKLVSISTNTKIF